TLKFGGNSVVLNNHSPDSAVANQTYIYDDSQERNVPGAQHTDGPGSLMDFGGKQGLGPWIFTEVDTAPSHVGTNNYLLMFLERQQDLKRVEHLGMLPTMHSLSRIDQRQSRR